MLFLYLHYDKIVSRRGDIMSFTKEHKVEIINTILRAIKEKKNPYNETLSFYKISRQTVYKYIKELIEKKLIKKVDNKNYTLSFYNFKEKNYKNINLQEDIIYKNLLEEFEEDKKENVIHILTYSFTEILNNAIEHSESKNIKNMMFINNVIWNIKYSGIYISEKIKAQENSSKKISEKIFFDDVVIKKNIFQKSIYLKDQKLKLSKQEVNYLEIIFRNIFSLNIDMEVSEFFHSLSSREDSFKKDYLLLTAIEKNKINLEAENKKEIVIIDKMGILTDFYQLADFVFVGGTLVNIGGHSILEPLFYGKKPIIGKYFQNIEEIVRDAQELGFIEVVENENEIIEYLKKSENVNTKRFFEKNNEIDKILNEIC